MILYPVIWLAGCPVRSGRRNGRGHPAKPWWEHCWALCCVQFVAVMELGKVLFLGRGGVKTFPHQGGWKHRWGKGTEDGQWEAKWGASQHEYAGVCGAGGELLVPTRNTCKTCQGSVRFSERIERNSPLAFWSFRVYWQQVKCSFNSKRATS